MSISMRIVSPGVPDHVFQVASSSGWAALCEWVEGLPEGYRAVKTLCGTGRVDNTESLQSEIVAALAKAPPRRPVRDTADGLVSQIAGGYSQESVEVLI